MTKKWPTLRIACYGAACGSMFVAAWISLIGGWHAEPRLLLVDMELVAAGTVPGACYAAIFSAARNFLTGAE